MWESDLEMKANEKTESSIYRGASALHCVCRPKMRAYYNFFFSLVNKNILFSSCFYHILN